MKKRIITVIIGATLLFTGCNSTAATPIKTNVANPFITCEDIDEGIEKSGIPIEVPESLGDFVLDSVTIKENELLQIYYKAGEYNLFLRKGYFDIENSGDYTKYDTEQTLVINGMDVRLGINNDYIYNATWMDNGYSYLLLSSAGLTEDSFARLIMQID